MVRETWFNPGVKSSHSNGLKKTGLKLKGENYCNRLEVKDYYGFNKSQSRWDRFDSRGHGKTLQRLNIKDLYCEKHKNIYSKAKWKNYRLTKALQPQFP